MVCNVQLVDVALLDGSKDGAKYKNLMNWSAAVGYGVGSGSPLSPSFNFSLELAKASQVSFLSFFILFFKALLNCMVS